MKILFYVCNGEFGLFESGRESSAFSSKTKRACVHHEDKFKVKIDVPNDCCFFALNDRGENPIVEKEEVKNCPSQSMEDLDAAMLRYLQMIETKIRGYFLNDDVLANSSVFVITHWGGGSGADIDEREEVIAASTLRISGGKYRNWQTFSASETMRPKLFSDDFSTVVARRRNSRAKLPDAEECARILERLKNKDYGCGAVNWDECNQKALYDDIMRHLNH